MTKLKTIKIKGNDYVMVKDRLLAFQELFPKGSIHTEILVNDDKSVVVKAIVRTEVGMLGRDFTGHSEAYREGNMGLVAMEVAETSAVGRALAMLGIGIIESVASADEIVKATGNGRSATEKQKDYLGKMIANKGLVMPDLDKMTMDEASKLIEKYKYKSKSYGANDRDFTADEEGGNKQDAIDESRQENYEIINRDK